MDRSGESLSPTAARRRRRGGLEPRPDGGAPPPPPPPRDGGLEPKPDGGALVFAGRVGASLPQRERDALSAHLDRGRIERAPFAGVPDGMSSPPPSRWGRPSATPVRFAWVRPELVVEVEYLEWTDDVLRQPLLMSTSGGGWTLVFLAEQDDYQCTSTGEVIEYSELAGRSLTLMESATEAFSCSATFVSAR